MNKNHVGETVGVFTITELMPYKDDDGHSLYKGKGYYDLYMNIDTAV